jgi:hypothetical protein
MAQPSKLPQVLQKYRLKRRLQAAVMILAIAVSTPSQGTEWGRTTLQPIAVLQGLDKITARISTITVPVGDSVRFGTLWITPRVCHKKPPEETPEAAAFLEIDQQKPDEPRYRLMHGWVFASSRGLNALEHPVYDVWLVDCKKADTDAQSPSSG